MEEKLNINWCRISSPAIPFIEFTNEVVNNALNVQEDFLSALRPRFPRFRKRSIFVSQHGLSLGIRKWNPQNLFLSALAYTYLKYVEL